MIRLVQRIAKKIETALCADHVSAEQEAWWILEKITGFSRAHLLFLSEQALTKNQETNLEKMLKQRTDEKMPLQYILGSVPFCGLDILVRSPILIPRPETEEWVSWLINLFTSMSHMPLKILDLCTGTGCIALALGRAFPESTIIGVDINPDAIILANKNKMHNDISNVTFLCSDLYSALACGQTFHLIVSNPPYITQKEYASLDASVIFWEDLQALVAKDDGMAIYQRIIQDAHSYLEQHPFIKKQNLPVLVLESGTTPQAIQSLLLLENFSNSHNFVDMQRKIRCICAQQKELI